MMLQLCTMAMVHCNNAVWVPMPIIHPKNWLLVVENSRILHSTRTAHGAPPGVIGVHVHRVPQMKLPGKLQDSPLNIMPELKTV